MIFWALRMRGRRPISLSMANGRVSRFISSVQAWVKANGITQSELAKELDVSEALISLWFKGERFPVGEQILHLQELMSKDSRKGKA
jgi:predicted transcriptional regulator